MVWRAIAALVNVSGDDWLREQTHNSHPIAAAAMFRYNRWRLVRLGVALGTLPVTAEVRARLLAAEHFRACATELDDPMKQSETDPRIVTSGTGLVAADDEGQCGTPAEPKMLAQATDEQNQHARPFERVKLA
jgi:hypothetical protein